MRNKKRNPDHPRMTQAAGRKFRLFAILWLTVLLAAAAVPSAAPAKTVEEVAVVVNGEALTRGELDEAILAYFMQQQMKPANPGTPAYESAKKDVIEGFVREVLFAEEADRSKIEISDSEIEREVNNQVEGMKKGFASEQEFNEELMKEGITLEDLRADAHDKILRRLKASRALRAKQQELPSAAVVTDEEAQAYFKEHPNDFEQIKFDIILFRVQANTKPAEVKVLETQAQAMLKELRGGGDFAAYAKKYSEDQGSAEKGGAIGTVFRSDLEPKLAKGIFAIPEKGLGIVKAGEGIYIVKVDFKGKADYPSVASEIKSHLQAGKKDSGLKDWVEDLEKKANIIVDGKAVSVPTSAGEKAGTGSGEGGAAAKAGEKSLEGEKSQAETTEGNPASENQGLYPTLAPGGTLVFSLGAQGFTYGNQDLTDYQAPGVNTKLDFPFGFGLDAGLDFALDPTFQVGFRLEGFQKTGVKLTDSATGYSYQWGGAVLAPSLVLKVLVPLDEGTNFMLSGAGGYYFLFGGKLTLSDSSKEEPFELTASNWGGEAGGSLEFFLDGPKKTALEIGAGYRYLKFNPLTTKNVYPIAGFPAVPSPLLNNDNATAASMDFSGVKVAASIRFYLGKEN